MYMKDQQTGEGTISEMVGTRGARAYEYSVLDAEADLGIPVVQGSV